MSARQHVTSILELLPELRGQVASLAFEASIGAQGNMTPDADRIVNALAEIGGSVTLIEKCAEAARDALPESAGES